jgi:hypothetical protein
MHGGVHAGHPADILLDVLAAGHRGEDCRVDPDVHRSHASVQSTPEAASAADVPGWTGVSPQDPAPRRTSPDGPEEGG